MSSRYPPRLRLNPLKVGAGKSSVHLQVCTVETRCNDKLRKDLDGMDVDYMACVASIFGLNDDIAWATGAYSASTSTHAEMNALATYIGQGLALDDVQTIEISAPPCRACAFVLELHGLVETVSTTKDIYKNFTGSWRWPDALKNPANFDQARWQTVQSWFAGSGLTETQILEVVVGVVESHSPH
jgi:deoxycytidylate deaminase